MTVAELAEQLQLTLSNIFHHVRVEFRPDETIGWRGGSPARECIGTLRIEIATKVAGTRYAFSRYFGEREYRNMTNYPQALERYGADIVATMMRTYVGKRFGLPMNDQGIVG